jgi:transposase
MFSFTGALSLFLCTHPTDMRKSFDGLCGEVSGLMGMNPLSGHVFVFVNKRRDRMKLLFWDRHGFWLFYKRLESGRFQLPILSANSTHRHLAYEELLLILEGIDLTSIRRRKRYFLAPAA